MKKILTTVAGLLTFALIGTACSAVDTKEATSTTPVSTSAVQEAIELRHDPVSRSVERPAVPVVFVAPGISHHQNHVNHVDLVKAAKAKLVKQKVIKPKVTKKKVYKSKKIYKPKVKKVYKKVTKSAKVGLSSIARCIGKYESGNNPKAQNGTTTASGYYQFVNGTWNHYGGYPTAADAPLSVQTAKFYQIWDGGRGAHHWVVAHKCGY